MVVVAKVLGVINTECDPVFDSAVRLCVTLVQELLVEWMKVVC